MPRLINAVPKYRKHRASGQATVKIAGRTHYLGPHGTKTSKAEYDRLVAEWLASGRSSSFGTTPDELTIAELLAAYLTYAKGYYGSGPRSEYAAMGRSVKPVKRLYSRTTAASFGPSEFEAIRIVLLDTGNSRTYINTTMRRIVRVFRWGAAKGLLPESVPRTLSLIPGLKKGRTEAPEPTPVEPVPDATVRATLPHLSAVVADMVRFQRLVGCRPAEVCRIRPCDVDRTGDVWRYRLDSHKTTHHGKERVIFIGPKAQDILRPYLLRAAESYCFSPQESEQKRRAEMTANRKTPLSCGNRTGTNRRRKPKKQPREHYDTCSYRRAIHYACDKAKIDRWSPNRLRHSAGTEVRRRFGLEAAQTVLGHAKADTTQIYAERDYELAASVARQIG